MSRHSSSGLEILLGLAFSACLLLGRLLMLAVRTYRNMR